MSLRRSITLLALAFGVLTAIVAAGMHASLPKGRLQAEMDKLRATEPEPTPVTPVGTLRDLRDAPRRKPICIDQFAPGCRETPPLVRPVTTTR